MTMVSQLIAQKGADVWSVQKGMTVLDAIRLMADKNIGSVLVMRGDQVIGLFTERHYARNVILKGKSSPSTAVEDIMGTAVLFVTPDRTVAECMAIMTHRRVRHLPVFEGGKVVGVVSIGDLVNSVIADQKFTIEQLEQYIGNAPG